MNGHLNNKVQEWKTGHKKGMALRGRVKEGSKEGEYDWCTFYIGMNTDF
jgi:hypothetical protein